VIVKSALWLACLAIAARACAQGGGEVRGDVVDARGGERLGKVQVTLVGTSFRATTGAHGNFDIIGVPPGDYVLDVSTVGYHLVKRPFHLNAGETQEFEIVLAADTLSQTNTVEVKAGPFDVAPQDSPSALTLSGNDAKNLGSVLADDPLRAVQDLPGVTSNDDFDARFALRGADFSRIGLYVDGVLLHDPFHNLPGQTLPASATAINGDLVDEMQLYEGAWPVRFGDRSAGVLDVETREGSRSETLLRAEASASNAGAMAEGPLGKKKRGSWLVAARKSYLQYLLERIDPGSGLAIGGEDVQARLDYDVTSKNHLTFYSLESYSNLNQAGASQYGPYTLAFAGYHYTLANLGWQYTPTGKLILTTHAAWMREKFGDNGPDSFLLGQGYYGEWVWNTTATWMWQANCPLDAGWSMRRLRDAGFLLEFDGNVLPVNQNWNGTALLDGGYVEQSCSVLGGRLRLTGGARWDRDSADGISATSPAASANIGLTKSTHLQLAFGQYVQFPELSVLYSALGGRGLLPMRSNQATAAIEQRLGERTRIRVETYNRADRDLIFQPFIDPRILSGEIFLPPANPLFENSLRGYARGAEIFLQRSSANRFTGWISYAYGRTGMHDGVSGAQFVADWDQRDTINFYGSYRLRPSINLSARATWGSGFPIPGFFTAVNGNYYLASVRNTARLGTYERTDVRINKAWTRDKWKITLYGEVINVTNRTNYLYQGLDGVNPQTGQAYLVLDTMFPILPSAGLMFER